MHDRNTPIQSFKSHFLKARALECEWEKTENRKGEATAIGARFLSEDGSSVSAQEQS